mmetsp:Transcript_14553/g.60718  ORF Transcript_14553/g.60718 Transcript_14553/m.60718 type:complete len:287 (-) Transcript_14553:465-1325(-)
MPPPLMISAALRAGATASAGASLDPSASSLRGTRGREWCFFFPLGSHTFQSQSSHMKRKVSANASTTATLSKRASLSAARSRSRSLTRTPRSVLPENHRRAKLSLFLASCRRSGLARWSSLEFDSITFSGWRTAVIVEMRRRGPSPHGKTLQAYAYMGISIDTQRRIDPSGSIVPSSSPLWYHDLSADALSVRQRLISHSRLTPAKTSRSGEPGAPQFDDAKASGWTSVSFGNGTHAGACPPWSLQWERIALVPRLKMPFMPSLLPSYRACFAMLQMDVPAWCVTW